MGVGTNSIGVLNGVCVEIIFNFNKLFKSYDFLLLKIHKLCI